MLVLCATVSRQFRGSIYIDSLFLISIRHTPNVARFPLFVHHDVDAWLTQHTSLARRTDWLLAELAARGLAGRPKGVVGPAREVLGLDGHRWRRSGLGGFDHYAWWFEVGDETPFPAGSRVVRAVRQHDRMGPLDAGASADYAERDFVKLEPLNEEQAAVVHSPARVRLAVGHPGTGKTGALLYAVVEEARLAPAEQLLYVTLSPGLVEDARQFLDGLPELDERVEVLTYGDLLTAWGGARRGAAPGDASDQAEERAFLGFIGELSANELGPWHKAREALWAEVRAQIVGRALPYALHARQQPCSKGPLLERDYYRRQRERDLTGAATRGAWQLAQRFVEQQSASVHGRAWAVLQRILDGSLDNRLRRYDGLVVDEIQDLTVLQLAVLVEAVRRIGELKGSVPCFIAAGDESQVVHPSGFSWGLCKDLLRERLGGDPAEFQLATNQRSPSPLVEASNRTAALYDGLPKGYRPQARVEAEKTEATNGRVFLARTGPDDPALGAWLELLRNTAGSAIVVCPGVKPKELTELVVDPTLADLCFEPAALKGLDRQYVVVWDASRVLRGLSDEIEAARREGERDPRYLAARRRIDEFRVAISRSNETLVFLDREDDPTDPLLESLVVDGVAERWSVALLRDTLALRGDDPLERTLQLFEEAADLLEVDLERALRSLTRADGALATLRDVDHRREGLHRRIDVRRRAAAQLLRAAQPDSAASDRKTHYDAAAEMLAEVARSYGELGEDQRATQHALLAERYREIPPGAPDLAARLPDLLQRYVAVLAELPKRDLRAAVLRLPRDWRDELTEVAWGATAPLAACLAASERLAMLTSAVQDREAAVDLREKLAALQLDRAQWAEALATLQQLPTQPPASLARCQEGLGAWQAAAQLREVAGELPLALANYRKAGAPHQAADLADRLGQTELATSLRASADLAGLLDSFAASHAPNLTEPELRRVSEALHRAAEALAPRHRSATDRRRR